MNLASLANQRIAAMSLGNIAQTGLGWAQQSKGWEGAGWGAWDVFLVEDAQTCGNCRNLKAFNSHKKVKVLTTVRYLLLSLALVGLDLQAGPFHKVGM